MINQTAYVIENGSLVSEVMIKAYLRGLFIVQFSDHSFSALKAHRLFLTKEKAEESMEKRDKRIKIARRCEGYDSPYRYNDPRNRYGA